MNACRCWLIALLVVVFATEGVSAQKTTEATSQPAKLDRAELEKRFVKTLTGSVLVGNFSVDGQAANAPARPERYEIASASKLPQGKDRWVIVAKFKYGTKNQSIPIPVTLDVLWAGDTPVMSLTDLSIPGFGTFTARVMIYGDRYAGTWQHGKVGGHMWGKVERAKKAKAKPDAEKAK